MTRFKPYYFAGKNFWKVCFQFVVLKMGKYPLYPLPNFPGIFFDSVAGSVVTKVSMKGDANPGAARLARARKMKQRGEPTGDLHMEAVQLGGQGGRARARAMTPEQRKEASRQAAWARWHKTKKTS